MLNRLLTDKELMEFIKAKPNLFLGDLTHASTIAKAQDAKTLKAVEKWLKQRCIKGDEGSQEEWIDPYITWGDLKTFEEGKIPEE